MNTSNPEPGICDQCGAPLSPEAPEGLCTRCLARFTLLAPDTDEGEPAEELFPDTPAAPLQRFGDYELLEEIAHGGMGVVYRARQVSLNRIVAVKMLLFGQFAGKAAFERFRVEAETVARLQHPNIVAIHEIGETDGQPFFSMDYVAGHNLADLARERPLPAREAAGYLRQIARAVAYAHTQGVLHRDLKPANVLIDAFDEPRITDFGLARQMSGDSQLTLSGQVLGSPNFMPPEQGAGKHAAIGPASDIYGLGAVLYYLLTARPPFVAETFESTLNQVLHAEPVPPRHLNPSIPPDLETICLKCLEKDPARRYASAADVADELDRFLKREPIHARPLGPLGRTWRWCRRKPAVAGMVAAVTLLLLTVTLGSLLATWRIATVRKSEQREAYYSSIALAGQYIEEGSIDRALATLWQCPAEYRHWEWGHLLYLCHQDAVSLAAHETNVTAVAFSPDNRWLVSADAGGLARVWDWQEERPVFTFGSSSNRAGGLAFAPQGGQLAAVLGTNGVTVWGTTNWQPQFTLAAGEVAMLAFSADGQRLVTGGTAGRVSVWNTASGGELQRLETTNQPIQRVAVSPDGQRLVAVTERGAWVWDLASGKPIRSFPAAGPSARSLFGVFADDTGERFATVDVQGQLALWKAGQAAQPLIRIEGSQSTLVRRAFFSPGSGWMLNAGEENTARLWDTATGQEHLAINNRVHQVAFSADASKMVTLGTENWVTVWEVEKRRKVKALRGHNQMVQAVTMSRDGKLVATGDQVGQVKVWSASLGRDLGEEDTWHNVAAYSPDGQRIVSGAFTRGWIVRSAQSGRVLLRVHSANEAVFSIAFSPDGQRIVTAGSHKTAKVWEVDSGRLLLTLRGHRRQVYCVDWSRDGRFIATSSPDGTAKIWDARSGEELRTLPMETPRGYDLTGYSVAVYSVQFDADSARLLTGSYDGMARIWDARTGALLREFRGAKAGAGLAAMFVTNLRQAATTDWGEGSVKLWGLGSGQLIKECKTRSANITGYDMSADGRRLIAASSTGLAYGFDSGTIEVWDIEGTPRKTLTLNNREIFASALFSRDVQSPRVLATSMDFCVHQWETFPWQSGAYPAAKGQRSGFGPAESVRRYARNYWRERLAAEREADPATAPPARVIELPLDRSSSPKRDQKATAQQIDLTDYYTGELTEPFYPDGYADRQDNDLAALPNGLVSLGGVGFDVRGVIQLRPTGSLGGAFARVWQEYPIHVDSIPVRQKVRQLHLLLGAANAESAVGLGSPEPDGTIVAKLVLHYEDGQQSALDLVYGRDVRAWWADPQRAAQEPTDRGRVVWTGSNPVATVNNRSLRLYLTSRANPIPEARIVSVDFVSTMSRCAPFLIALTVE